MTDSTIDTTITIIFAFLYSSVILGFLYAMWWIHRLGKRARASRAPYKPVERKVAVITASLRSFREFQKQQTGSSIERFVWISKPQDAMGHTFDYHINLFPLVDGNECEREVMINTKR